LIIFVYIQNDHDPSKLVAETPCKLLRYLVLDGSHIDADTPYAEVEVMKMCMPLLSPASGVIHFKMSEGQAMQVNYVQHKKYEIINSDRS
jgi:acetyl-CoA carboxylase/biotin carboxylase 1